MKDYFCGYCKEKIDWSQQSKSKYNHRNDVNAVYCSAKCWKKRWRKNLPDYYCTTCKSKINWDEQPLRKFRSRWAKSLYCSKICSHVAMVKHGHLNKNVLIEHNKQYASERMKEKNPMHNLSTRQKVSITLRKMKHKPSIQWWNWKPSTIYETAMSFALGWPTNIIVNTWFLKEKYNAPNHYKIDLWNELLKIAIEIDWNSHYCLKRKEQDLRKQSLLEELGWKVLRFTNTEVENDINWCVEKILSII